jgi:hypothetical protein
MTSSEAVAFVCDDALQWPDKGGDSNGHPSEAVDDHQASGDSVAAVGVSGRGSAAAGRAGIAHRLILEVRLGGLRPAPLCPHPQALLFTRAH